jgi:hypothetical protein
MADPLADLLTLKAKLDAMPPIPVALWVIDNQAAEYFIMLGLLDASGHGIGGHNAQLYAIQVKSWHSISATEKERAWMRRHGPAALLDAAPGIYLEMNKGPIIAITATTSAEFFTIGQVLAKTVYQSSVF